MTLPAIDDELFLYNKTKDTYMPIDAIFDKGEERWDKVFPKQLARMLDIIGDEKMKVVAYLIKHKDRFNGVNATMKEISKSTGVSINTVSRVMKKMQEHDYLNKVRNGKWRFTPRVIRAGDRAQAAATFSLYDNSDHDKA